MIWLGVFLALGIMAAMINMALNKKSNLKIRLASLGALALMVLTVIICLFIIFTDTTVPVDPSTLIVGAPAEPPVNTGNTMPLILLTLVLLVLFGIIVLFSMKEHKKHSPKVREEMAKAGKIW